MKTMVHISSPIYFIHPNMVWFQYQIFLTGFKQSAHNDSSVNIHHLQHDDAFSKTLDHCMMHKIIQFTIMHIAQLYHKRVLLAAYQIIRLNMLEHQCMSRYATRGLHMLGQVQQESQKSETEKLELLLVKYYWYKSCSKVADNTSIQKLPSY